MSIKDVRIEPAIFREYDVRGIAGKDLSPDFAELLGIAYSQLLKKAFAHRPAKDVSKTFTVSIGRDCRLTSDDYAESLIEGILSQGVNVVRIGVCPTPVTYFSLYHLHFDGAIMITGSHNAADYNGFKICIGQETLHGPQIQELLKVMRATQATANAARSNEAVYQNICENVCEPVRGSVSDLPMIPAYQNYLVQHSRKLQPKKIVLDSGNGTAGAVAPELFRKLGATVIDLFGELDGQFPNHHPDPTISSNLKSLIDTVRKEKADFGIGFDGDADRIGLVDETGKIVYGDELMVLFSRDILAENPGATIISEVKSSHRLYNDIKEKGGRGIMWKAGHSVIKAKMIEERALLAGELSGHIFFSDRYFGFDDAIYAALRVYEIASQKDVPLSQLLSDLPSSVVTPEIRVECEETRKFKLVAEMQNRLRKLPFQMTEIDGMRIDFGDGWGLVRASNTQPALVLRFEAPNQIRLDEIQSVFETALRESARALGHPSISSR